MQNVTSSVVLMLRDYVEGRLVEKLEILEL